jgi:hypothetical protein
MTQTLDTAGVATAEAPPVLSTLMRWSVLFFWRSAC